MTVPAEGEGLRPESRLELDGARELRMTDEMYWPDVIRIQPLLLTVPLTRDPLRSVVTTRCEVLAPDRTLPAVAVT
ncbi:MAG: hypothetical protein WA903_13760 [Ornithinimicrobium sp.]